MVPLDRKAVLVTGVSSGIGRAIATDLLNAGYTVFGSVRRIEDAAGIAQQGQAFTPCVFDVTDPTGISRAVAEIESQVGSAGLTALVNNAGVNFSGPFLYQPEAQFRQVMDVNFHGLVSVTRAFLPLLGARDDAGARPGRIVNIGSVQGAMTVPFMAAYSASKHAVEAFAQGLRRELLPYGIAVSTIEPNFTKSEMFGKAKLTSEANRYEGTIYADAWAQFNAALAEKGASAKPAITVARKARHAIEATRPRARYPLDPIWHIGRYLPDRMFDAFILKGLGIAHLMRPRSVCPSSGRAA